MLSLIEEPSEIPYDVQVVTNEGHEGIKLQQLVTAQGRIQDFSQEGVHL